MWLSWQNACLESPRLDLQHHIKQIWETRVHASNASNLEVEKQEGHPWLYNKFKPILNYV